VECGGVCASARARAGVRACVRRCVSVSVSVSVCLSIRSPGFCLIPTSFLHRSTPLPSHSPQDKLHENICRKRTLVAIGTHDLDTIQVARARGTYIRVKFQ
jgi:hypothetical protein